VLSFLRYYVRLRVNVLLGRHNTSRPLGLRYRWQQWQYTQHLKWITERGWVDKGATEAITEARPQAKSEDKTADKQAKSENKTADKRAA
jgi:hypothetical protein